VFLDVFLKKGIISSFQEWVAQLLNLSRNQNLKLEILVMTVYGT